MQFGLILPHIGPGASPEAIDGAARLADEAGFHSVWVLDRLLYPTSPRTPYPGTADGSLPDVMQTVFEPMTTLTWLAGRTRNVRLGTGVLVSAFRSPVLLARMGATLDQLSGGRFICGLGMGWSQDEYEASGVDFREKGARLDEYIDVVRNCWTQETPSYHGRFYTLPESHLRPGPVQKPHPPLWVGGDSEAAVRRAVERGTGWFASGYLALDDMLARIDLARRLILEKGGAPSAFHLGMWAPMAITPAPTPMPLVGPPQHVREGIEEYEDMGIGLIVLALGFIPGTNPVEDLQRFLAEVRPQPVPA